MVRRACRAGSCRAWGGVPRPSNLLFVFRRLAVADEARPRKLHPRLDRQSFGSRRIRQSGTGNGGRHSSTGHQKHTAMKESVPRHRVNIGPLSERPIITKSSGHAVAFRSSPNGHYGHSDVWVRLHPHLTWQATKSYVERGNAFGFISHKGSPTICSGFSGSPSARHARAGPARRVMNSRSLTRSPR